MFNTSKDPIEDEIGEEPRAEVGALFDSVVSDVKGWLETRKDLLVLEASERLGRISGALMSNLILVMLGGFALLMASLALGIWLGQQLNNNVYGFLLVAGIYLLLFLLFALFGSRTVRDRTTLHMINASRDDETDV